MQCDLYPAAYLMHETLVASGGTASTAKFCIVEYVDVPKACGEHVVHGVGGNRGVVCGTASKRGYGTQRTGGNTG